uniref:Leucine-rich repeat-containing N-terminal plant-type domain-containing protein n=1 Tax=Ananas comosus var. bracteatus TaxID=296719 RepID=A0A6V7PI64_ANACO|nr:unnamed protein product [Ananas comosus var. bracteatus]
MVKSVATSLSFSLLVISASVAFVVADTNVNVKPLFDVAAALNNPPELIKSWKGDNPCRGGRAGSWEGVLCDATATVVSVVDFTGRNFSGTISPHFADLTGLTEILLAGNRLQGPIPDSLTTLSFLQLLDVTNNDLSGKVPKFALNVTLKLSGNHFDP